jgi:hypothetical protein
MFESFDSVIKFDVLIDLSEESAYYLFDIMLDKVVSYVSRICRYTAWIHICMLCMWIYIAQISSSMMVEVRHFISQHRAIRDHNCIYMYLDWPLLFTNVRC